MDKEPETHNAAMANDGILKDPVRALAAMRLFYEKGETMALIAAFDLITQHYTSLQKGNEETSATAVDMKVPLWLINGIYRELVNSFKKGRKIGKGQLSTTYKRTQKSQEHLTRYIAVESLILSSEKNGAELKIGKAVALAKMENSEAFKNVTEGAIYKSHRKVSKEIADPDFFWKYFPQSSRLKNLMDELTDCKDT